MSFKVKLIILVAIPILTLIVLGILGSSFVEDVNTQNQKLVEEQFVPIITDDIPQINAYNRNLSLILNADRDAHQAMIAEIMYQTAAPEAKEGFLKDHAENVQQVIDRISKASKTFSSKMMKSYSEFKDAFELWKGKSNEVIKDSDKDSSYSKKSFDDMREYLNLLGEMEEERITATIEVINKRKTDAFGKQKVIESGIKKTLLNMKWGIAGIIIVVLVVAYFVSSSIAKGIINPVKLMGEALDSISKGDLTVHVDIKSKDEIGLMAQGLNSTVAHLHDVITQIQAAADHTASSGEELSGAAQNISDGAQNQASSVEEISASIQELTSSIVQVSENANHANENAKETTKLAQAGNTTVNKSIEGMQLIDESSTKISKIIEVIGVIANQTNLLALNAAIEAARAGRHGLGFAVVADEVRELAGRTAKAAEEITQLINESTQCVAQGSSLSQEVGTSLTEILEGIESNADSLVKITQGTSQQSATANQVSKAIEIIASVTEENSASAEEMAASSKELSSQAQRLKQLVSHFKLNNQSTVSQNPQDMLLLGE